MLLKERVKLPAKREMVAVFFILLSSLRLNSLFLSAISGDYTCEIETFGDPLSQRNQLDVLVPPVINMLNPGNNITVKRGSTVKLSCNATGFPQPEIVWQREVSL